MKLTAFLICLLSFAASAAAKPLLLVVVGQSNASGYGTTGNDVPAYLQAVQPNVQMWRNTNFGVGPPVYGFQSYQAGVNSIPGSVTPPMRWGPEAAFCYQWTSANPGQTIYYVQNALAGSQLESLTIETAPGAANQGWCPTDSGQLFAGTITTIADAQAAMTTLGVTSYNTVVLWMQGETDASDPICSAAYYANLKAFDVAVRSQWLLGSSVPIIIGRIAEVNWQYAAGVRLGESQVPAETANTFLVNTDGFPLAADNIHYTAAGQVDLGLAMYGAYLSYLNLPAARANLGGAFSYVNTPYAATPSIMAPTASYTVQEGPANTTLMGTPAITNNTANPTPQYDLLSTGQPAGLTIENDTAAITVTDGTQLLYANGATRTFTARASGGVNEATTVVTLNLTQESTPTDVPNTVFRADPNNSSYYTTSAGAYTVFTDTEGSGATMTSSSGHRPTQTTFPGISFNCGAYAPTQAMASTASATFCGPTDFNYTIAAVVYPSSSGSGNGIIAAVSSGTTAALDIYYNYTTQTFGVSAQLAANGASTTATTTSTFANNTGYYVRLQKQGPNIYFYVNGTLQAMTAFSGALRSTVLGSGNGTLVIGGASALSGTFTGDIGLVRFIDGNPDVKQVIFLNTEMEAWLAGT